jgi:hypothetical protein
MSGDKVPLLVGHLEDGGHAGGVRRGRVTFHGATGLRMNGDLHTQGLGHAWPLSPGLSW